MKYPDALIVRPLTPVEWPLVKGMFETGWKGVMPTAGANLFYGIFLGEEIVGFAHLEQVFHLNAVYVDPKHRAKHLMEACFETIDDDMPRNASMLIFPYRGLGRLMRRFKFWGGKSVKYWRKDY